MVNCTYTKRPPMRIFPIITSTCCLTIFRAGRQLLNQVVGRWVVGSRGHEQTDMQIAVSCGRIGLPPPFGGCTVAQFAWHFLTFFFALQDNAPLDFCFITFEHSERKWSSNLIGDVASQIPEIAGHAVDFLHWFRCGCQLGIITVRIDASEG